MERRNCILVCASTATPNVRVPASELSRVFVHTSIREDQSVPDLRHAPPERDYVAESPVTGTPPWRALPERPFSPAFLDARARALDWIEDYYDREHLTRAADWMLVVAPDAPEHLVLAALMHDLERSVPGGPVLDLANPPWDDRAYNDAHTGRSAEIVSAWLLERDAP